MPFAEYQDFDDCVAQNADKEDPAAYCAEIERATEGVSAAIDIRSKLRRAMIAAVAAPDTTTEFNKIADGLIDIPALPPDEWFASLDDVEPYDVVVEPNGHIHGFPAASWNDCHLSYPDQCVTPPRSMTDYTLFKVGQVTTASGAVVRTGPITLRGGHAPHGVSRQAAQKFYDDTDSAIADVAIGDGQYGIWINGAIRPDTTVAEVRRAMSSGFSGDWREWQGNLELIAFSAVNTPGFRRKAAVWDDQRMVASADISGFGTLCATFDIPRRDVDPDGPEDADELMASMADRIASTIGRSRTQLLDQLHIRVHG